VRKAGPTPGWLCRPIVMRLEGRDSPRRRERGREVSERLVEGLSAQENCSHLQDRKWRSGQRRRAKTKTTTPSTASVIWPNEDAVKEVKVVANNIDAKNGRYAGGQVQVTPANGTNEFHGSAFIKIDRRA
jgi:hypothetical protein